MCRRGLSAAAAAPAANLDVLELETPFIDADLRSVQADAGATFDVRLIAWAGSIDQAIMGGHRLSGSGCHALCYDRKLALPLAMGMMKRQNRRCSGTSPLWTGVSSS